jgi:hypothetical protein
MRVHYKRSALDPHKRERLLVHVGVSEREIFVEEEFDSFPDADPEFAEPWKQYLVDFRSPFSEIVSTYSDVIPRFDYAFIELFVPYFCRQAASYDCLLDILIPANSASLAVAGIFEPLLTDLPAQFPIIERILENGGPEASYGFLEACGLY